MAIRCLYCGMDYDVTLFEFERTIICVCGKTVAFKHELIYEPGFRRLKDQFRE